MARFLAEKPDIQPIVLPTTWVDKQSGLIVPKEVVKNLQWRARMLTAADTDVELQADLYSASSSSVLFFINAFCFTLRIFEPSATGENQSAEHSHLPYITWPIQDEHILAIESAMDKGTSLLTDKSRDMGATWDHIAVYVHRLLFKQDETHLMISRKEDAVDQLDGQPKSYPFGTLADPGTLFGKIDYILSRLPEWMIPRLMRKKMHIVNVDNKTRIDGESSNATAGSSDRRDSIFLDEMAKMREGESIKRSTRDVTACRLPCSTPNGAGTAYSAWRLSGQIPVFVLGWYDHPEKGAGRYASQDKLGRWEIRSPWFDIETQTRTPKELAIEVCMDHVGSGDTFFESQIIEQHKKLFARPPRRSMTIGFTKDTPDHKIPGIIMRLDMKSILKEPKGPLKIWTGLMNGRPDQTKTYTVGVDIGKGQGASNSVIAVMQNETNEKIAEWADANTPIHEFAKIAAAICVWVGGRNKRPLLIWENNGDPGFDFGYQTTQVCKYPNIYFDKQAGTLREKKGKRYGWRSSPEKKAVGLGTLRRAYSNGKIINHSAEALTECLSYVHYESGGIGPASLVAESDSARKAHGDRVIADMLCVLGRADTPAQKMAGVSAPQRSIGHRFEQFRKMRKAENQPGKTFNFQTMVNP